MKLRRSVSPHQLLFALLAGLFLSVNVLAQDEIVLQGGKREAGKIVGVSNRNVQIQIGSGTVGYPLNQVAQVRMAEPPQLADAIKAYQAGDLAKALSGVKPIADKYTGLPTPWAQQAAGALGDILVDQGKYDDAAKAYANFQANYGAHGGIRAHVGMARIDIAKKAYADAKKRLEPIVGNALKEEKPQPQLAQTYSQAFYLMGQIDEAEGRLPEALQNYLRTVTLFPADATAAQAAQQRADQLRKDHAVAVP